MEFQLDKQEHGEDNIDVIIMGIYTDDEFEALTVTKTFVKPCIKYISAELGFYRNQAKVHKPTFHDLYDPGIRIEGFTHNFANSFISHFHNRFGYYIKRELAPILQRFKSYEHKVLEHHRDVHFGTKEIGHDDHPQLPPPKKK